MTKDEAIIRCKEEAAVHGDIFGSWHVIQQDRKYEVVSDHYLKNYMHFGKIYHTETVKEPKDVDEAEDMLKGLLLKLCKTRKDRRILERKLKNGGIREFFKKRIG